MATHSTNDATIRVARPDDHEDVRTIASSVWTDRGGDYLPSVYQEWISGERRRTLVAELEGTVVGIAQCVALSPFEAWCQGMRVHPDYRGQGLGTTITEALFDWAREQGATVARNMVFSWNGAGLGQSRAIGFEPVAAFRWVRLEPDSGATPTHSVTDDPDVAWTTWASSEARNALAGLALDPDESWALSELTRRKLHRAANDRSVVTVIDGRARATSFRTQLHERQTEEGSTTHLAEYGVATWTGPEIVSSLFDAISADAAAIDADAARVLIPETPRHVTDAAYARGKLSDEPSIVLSMDLTSW